MKKVVFLVVCLFSGFANAGVIWQLNNFTFDDGATATGYFEWESNTVVDWSFSTTAGWLEATDYSDETGDVFVAELDGSLNFVEGTNSERVDFRFSLSDLSLLNTPVASLPLYTDEPAFVGPNGFLECKNCGSFRFGEAGAFLSAVDVNEPAVAVLFALGLAFFGVSRKRNA